MSTLAWVLVGTYVIWWLIDTRQVETKLLSSPSLLVELLGAWEGGGLGLGLFIGAGLLDSYLMNDERQSLAVSVFEEEQAKASVFCRFLLMLAIFFTIQHIR